jgi:hypothetical protein
MGGPTSSIRYCQHSSWDTQHAPPNSKCNFLARQD